MRIIRRHRLAERLFADVLGMNMEQIEKAACNFEHAVVPEVTEGICTLLGHPHECPHGKPIPPGKCCRERRQEVKQAVMPLSEVLCGRQGRVAYVRPQNHDRLHLLLSMGIAPGAHLSVHQRTPVMVVTVEQSEFAMDREVAKDVYVWLDPKA
jgi:DtxR family Mn-dependent transcriptional regulator